MSTTEMEQVTASEIRLGDMVDLADGPYFRHGDEPTPIDSEYGVVGEIVRESAECIVIDFSNIGTAGYDPNHVFTIVRRDSHPAGYYERFKG